MIHTNDRKFIAAPGPDAREDYEDFSLGTVLIERAAKERKRLRAINFVCLALLALWVISLIVETR